MAVKQETIDKYVGKVFKTNKCGDVEVLEYINSSKVLVKFIKCGAEKFVSLQSLKMGSISNKTAKRKPNGVSSLLRKRARHKWGGMFERCYSERYLSKNPTYRGCEVSDEFKDFEYFYEWCINQTGFANHLWHLEKDILVKGNKVYGEHTCCFVPQEINNLFVLHKPHRGGLPIGVRYNKIFNLYYSSVRIFNEEIDLGFYCTPTEAFYAYKAAKESHIKDVANKWKDQIDLKVYEALMNWTIEIDD